ncbi:Protein yif1b, partial [Perkinsus olseni]
MYIPLMSFITYVLAFAVIKGAADDGSFHPDILYDTATFAAVLSTIELVLARAAGYFVNMTSLRLLDLVCVIGYKYFHLSVYCIARILLSSKVPTAYFWWGLLGYLSLAAAYACLVSLQYFTTYKTAMQAHLEVSGSHTSILIKYVVIAIALCQVVSFFHYAAVLMPSVAATKDIIRARQECVRMLLKEQLGERQPLAGEYPCHSCTDVPACTLEELLADLPCPKPLTHRRVASDPCRRRGQQLCATISPAGLRHGGAFRDGPSSTSEDPMKLLGHTTRQPTGHFDTDRPSPGHIRRFDVGDSVALQRGLEVPCNWELIQGPLRVIPDSSSSSSVSRDERTLVSADRLHQEVHRVKREERGPAREEGLHSVAHETSVSLTPLVTPRSTEGDQGGSCEKVGISTLVQTPKVLPRRREVPAEGSAKPVRRAKSSTVMTTAPLSRGARPLRLGPARKKPCTGSDLRAIRGDIKPRGPTKALLPCRKAPSGKTVSFGENCPALRRPLPRRKGPKRPPCGSWSDTEVAVERPGQRPSRSASMSPRLKRVTVGPRRRPHRVVGGSRPKLEVLPPWQPGKGYSEARRRALQQVRERYLLKRRMFKLWVEVKRDLRARKDTQKAVLSIRGKPCSRGVPPDVCHTRTSLLRNSVKLPAGPPPPATLSEPVRPPAARRGRPGREDGCAFCDHREVVSDVRARYA